MMNSTQVWYLSLSAYLDAGPFRYLGFLVLVALYWSILGANVLLLLVIWVNRSLHEPMYVFLCSLCVNQLYGSTGLFPFLLVHVLSDVHFVPVALCFLQIFCLYTYGGVEVLTLAVMAYDRYLAICWPLQYGSLMTPRRVSLLIALSWLGPVLGVLVVVSLSAGLRLCGNVIHRVYCGNYAIVKLSCSNISANNIYGLFYTVLSIMVPLALILYTYARILKVCVPGSRQARQKAVSTCAPHLASVVNFCFGCCFQIFQSRFDVSRVPPVLGVLLSLYFLTCQPLLNPLLYGLKVASIRGACRRLLAAGEAGPQAALTKN